MRKVCLALGWFLATTCMPARANDGAAIPHHVRAGETLRALAERYHVSEGEVRRANPRSRESPPLDAVVLIPPPPSGWPLHSVVAGQTLWGIARAYQVPLDELTAANPTASEKLEVGQQIAVPGGSVTPAPQPTPCNQSTPAPMAAWLQVHLADGRVAWVPSQSLLLAAEGPLAADRVVEIARKLQGVPYVWGGETPNGVDCSGFVEQVFYLGGHHLPRLADQQFAATVEVAADDMRPGDLVFFTTYLPGPSHVGIYLGERRFLHASSSRGVTESSLDETYYAQRFLGAHRLAEWK